MKQIYYTIGGLICKAACDFNFKLPKHIEPFQIGESPKHYDFSIDIKLFSNEIEIGERVYVNSPNINIYKMNVGYRFDFISDENCYIKSTVVDINNSKIYLFYNSDTCFQELSTHFLESTQFMLAFILLLISNFDGFLLHSGAVVVDKYGVLYYGKSGVGKTTLSEIFLKKYNVLTDETAIIRNINGKYFVFGSYWKGSGNDIYSNSHSEIKFTMSIYHSKINTISSIRNEKALQLILEQSFPAFWDYNLIAMLISKINAFIKNTTNFSLGFVPNMEICEFLNSRVFSVK